MKQTIIEIISILFMILFLYTGISKLMDFQVFEEQLKESIFKLFAPFVALALPLVEVCVALLLLIPKWRLKGLYFSLLLMIAFTIYVIGLVSFAHELPCSCGGVLQEMSWPQHIIFNCAFLGLSILGIRLYKRLHKDNNQLEKPIAVA